MPETMEALWEAGIKVGGIQGLGIGLGLRDMVRIRSCRGQTAGQSARDYGGSQGSWYQGRGHYQGLGIGLGLRDMVRIRSCRGQAAGQSARDYGGSLGSWYQGRGHYQGLGIG